MGRALQDQIVTYLRGKARPVSLHTIHKALALPFNMLRRALRALVRSGRVRRTPSGRYGVPSQRRRRVCLGCGRAFKSDGPHNRLCPGCAERTSRPAHRYVKGRGQGSD